MLYSECDFDAIVQPSEETLVIKFEGTSSIRNPKVGFEYSCLCPSFMISRDDVTRAV